MSLGTAQSTHVSVVDVEAPPEAVEAQEDTHPVEVA